MNLARTITIALRAIAWIGLAACLILPTAADAGSIFVSGEDPDFHATAGGNQLGAQHIIQDSLRFVRNGNSAPILLLESNTSNLSLGDHRDSEQGLIASGFSAGNTSGNHYVKLNAAQFTTADLSQFSAIFVPSDHGGTLTGDDLKALNARSGDLINYLNSGGGLVAFAEDGFRQPASTNPQPPNFMFLPFLETSTSLSKAESGNTVTPFGASLGLTNGDVNGNWEHDENVTIFTTTGRLNAVDVGPQGEIPSLAFRGQISAGGVVPEPSTLLLGSIGILGLVGYGVLRRVDGAKSSCPGRTGVPSSQ